MYSTGQVRQMTGLTAKSLRHYERLDLVKPARTPAGYRRYSRADVARIYQLLALKSFGFSLRTIQAIVAGRRIDLSSHIDELTRERDRLMLAIETLRHLPAAVEDGITHKRLIAEAVWEWSEARYREARTTTPPVPARVCESRVAAFRELAAALETDPTSDRTRALAIAFRNGSDPEARTAVRNRAEWSTGMRRYFASLYGTTPETWERVLNFLGTLPPAIGAA